MLPTPVSFSKRRTFRRNATAPRRKLIDVLLARARLTNLGVVLLGFVAALSLISNVRFWFFPPTYSRSAYGTPIGILATISRNKSLQNLDHLIIVPGHAIWKGADPELRSNEDEWVLEPYQRGGGRVTAFFGHILKG